LKLVVDAFTSIKTTSGWADQGAAALAYDLLFRWNLRIYPCFRDFVSVRPGDVTSQAKAYRLFLNADFAESTVTTALTPLDEETDVSAVKLPTPTYVDLTPTEYGFGTLRTLKLKNRSLVPIDPILANAVAFHQVRTVDRLVRAELDAVSSQVYMDQAGATNTAVNDLVAGDVLTAQAVRQAHTKLVNAGSMPRDGQFYAAIIHPHTELSPPYGVRLWWMACPERVRLVPDQALDRRVRRVRGLPLRLERACVPHRELWPGGRLQDVLPGSRGAG
jgi:hypothetical protein